MANITDGTAEWKTVDARDAAIFDLIYPVGSVFATTGIAPALGTWEEIAQGRTLQGADDSHAAGTTIEAGLPNITATIGGYGDRTGFSSLEGAFYSLHDQSRIPTLGDIVDGHHTSLIAGFSASRCSAIYGKSSTVQPAAYVVHFYRRIA